MHFLSMAVGGFGKGLEEPFPCLAASVGKPEASAKRPSAGDTMTEEAIVPATVHPDGTSTGDCGSRFNLGVD